MRKVVSIVQKIIVLYLDGDSRSYCVVDLVVPGGVEVGLEQHELCIDGMGLLLRESGRAMKEGAVKELFASGILGDPYAAGGEPDPDDPVVNYDFALNNHYRYDEELYQRF